MTEEEMINKYQQLAASSSRVDIAGIYRDAVVSVQNLRNGIDSTLLQGKQHMLQNEIFARESTTTPEFERQWLETERARILSIRESRWPLSEEEEARQLAEAERQIQAFLAINREILSDFRQLVLDPHKRYGDKDGHPDYWPLADRMNQRPFRS